ncbi:MAG: hypothetical protein JWP89_4534 [Schlesneria sp.]|nr:hypothetical protein [Schlesneria sp.]
MNDQTPIEADARELQLDEAEYSAPTIDGATCTACHMAIPDQYFQVNGAILCEPCSTAVKAHLTGGAGFPRFLKACFGGLAASIAGFLIYFTILKVTGYEIGLISILVGYMVGTVVRNCSGGRGGAIYQVIAVCCTYFAIAMSYSALLIPELLAQMKNKEAAVAEQQVAEKAGKVQEGAAANLEAEIAKEDEPVPQKELTSLDVVFAILLIAAFLLALPVISWFSQPIGMLIVGFALWEAFKLTRKVELVITGPHNIGHTPDLAPANA